MKRLDQAIPTKSAQRIYDFLGKRYDWFGGYEARAKERSAEMLGLTPGLRLLEVGVGTGRFASAFGVEEGVDPSPSMLDHANRRGVHTQLGTAEKLPYEDGTFDGVLVVTTLCFTTDPARSLLEFARVLKSAGAVVIGLIPASSPWGRKKPVPVERFPDRPSRPSIGVGSIESGTSGTWAWSIRSTGFLISST